MEEEEKPQHDTLIIIIHCIPYTYLPMCREIYKEFALAVIELLAFQGWNGYVSAKKAYR